MRLQIETNSHLPVYAQLKEQIKFLILNGELAPGTPLPTTRQLAGFLGINRNTVHRAYQELQQEGLIRCQRGRDCEVVERPGAVAQPISARLLAIIDQAIEQAGELGVTPDDFATYVYARARQRQDVPVARRLAFVECQEPIAVAMAQAIEARLQLPVAPIVLGDLQDPSEEIEARLQEAQVVATTFFHIQEVRRLLAGRGKEVVAIGVKPHLDKLIQIAQLPQGTPAALVCLSESCALDMERSLENAGIRNLEPTLCGVDEPQRLSSALPAHGVVIASDFVAHQVQPLMQPGQRLITLDYTQLDEGAIDLLRSVLHEGTGPRTG